MAKGELPVSHLDKITYYDRFSRYYDEETEAADLPAKIQALMGEAFKLKPPETVKSALDLGAGTGHAIDAIKEQAAPQRIVAVDPSPGMLAHLRRKYSPEEVEIVTDTMERYLSYSDEQPDLITCFGTLELLEDAPGAVADAARLLPPGGLFAGTYAARAEGEEREIFSDDSATLIASTMMEYRWWPEEIEDALTNSGLTIAGRIDGVRIQEQDDETDTAERTYNFVMALKPEA